MGNTSSMVAPLSAAASTATTPTDLVASSIPSTTIDIVPTSILSNAPGTYTESVNIEGRAETAAAATVSSEDTVDALAVLNSALGMLSSLTTSISQTSSATLVTTTPATITPSISLPSYITGTFDICQVYTSYAISSIAPFVAGPIPFSTTIGCSCTPNPASQTFSVGIAPAPNGKPTYYCSGTTRNFVKGYAPTLSSCVLSTSVVLTSTVDQTMDGIQKTTVNCHCLDHDSSTQVVPTSTGTLVANSANYMITLCGNTTQPVHSDRPVPIEARQQLYNPGICRLQVEQEGENGGENHRLKLSLFDEAGKSLINGDAGESNDQGKTWKETGAALFTNSTLLPYDLVLSWDQRENRIGDDCSPRSDLSLTGDKSEEDIVCSYPWIKAGVRVWHGRMKDPAFARDYGYCVMGDWSKGAAQFGGEYLLSRQFNCSWQC